MEKLELGDLLPDIFRMCNQDKPFLVKMMAHLEKSFFESKIFSKIFLIYKLYFDKYQKSPTEKILRAELIKSGEKQELVDVIAQQIFGQDVLDPGEKDYITDLVITYARKQRMKVAIEQAYDKVEDGEFTDEKFHDILSNMKESVKFSIDTDLGVDLFDIDERYLRIADALQDKVSTGFRQIDFFTGGGFAKKELVAIQAPPGIGKTIWLVNLGFKFLTGGHNVVHYSMEMSEERLGLRYDGVASGVTVNSLGRLEGLDDVKAAYKKLRMLTKTNLRMKEFPTGSASVYDIEAHIDELELYYDFKPDVVIVDYGDIMKSTRNTKSTYEEQGWIFRELRALAIKKNIVIVTATQSRRDALKEDGGTKDIVGMDQVADSMEKNRILDLLFSVQQTREEKDEGKINLWIAKNRNGESNKKMEFLINYRVMKITEIQVATGT